MVTFLTILSLAAEPALHHAPATTAHAGEDIAIGARIDHPEAVKRAVLVFESERTRGEVEFARASNAERPYVATIPASAVHGASLGYAIELETTTGEVVPVFGTRADLHRVTVLDSPEDVREAADLARLGGRRSLAAAGGDWVDFGGAGDSFYRFEGSYTYRLLGTVTEFGVRAGMVRGESPGSREQVGLNYGAARVRLRATDWLHVDAELLTSVTEVGFSTGGGGAFVLGDPFGSKLVLGLEAIETFGVRGSTRLDVVAHRRLVLSPIVEVTSMPHADQAGVRLLAEAGVDVGRGLRLDLRGGYQARTFDRGGPAFGGGVAYAF